jgi:hypothetical protein
MKFDLEKKAIQNLTQLNKFFKKVQRLYVIELWVGLGGIKGGVADSLRACCALRTEITPCFTKER